MGEDPKESIREFWGSMKIVALSGITIYALLVGISKLFFPQTDESVYLAIGLVILGLIPIPFWWKEAR